MLNKYESIYIINPDVDAEGIKGLVEKFNALIESEGGKVTETNEWGMKKLAYPIKKFTQGYYVLVNFEAKPEFIDELERIYKITDTVIKFITVRKEDK
jgi:small subunit ribosomal protein S6